MRKIFTITTFFVFVALVLATFSVVLVSSPSVHANSIQNIHVIEHITAMATGDVPPKGDSAGDQLVFHNPLFDEANKKQVGHDNGACVRTVVGKVWECFTTIFLPKGQLTVEGPFYDNGTDSMLAITGGTGAYQVARGQMRLHATGHPVGSQFDFFLTIIT
jgi:hypothetical protein